MLVSTKIAQAHYLNKVSEIPIGCAGIGEGGTVYFRISQTEILIIIAASLSQNDPMFPVSVMSIRGCRKTLVRPLKRSDKVIFHFDEWDNPHEVKTAHLHEKTPGKPDMEETMGASGNG